MSFFLGLNKIAELLIQEGANVNVLAVGGDTPLIYAIKKSKHEFFTHAFIQI